MNLNTKQIEAIEHKNGPLLILAGAGSGKTTVLTYRIQKMIEEGVDPRSILCVTFTNKAVNELKERIVEKCGKKGELVWVSTFHFLCLDILRTSWGVNFSTAHTHQSRQFVKEIIDEMNPEKGNDFLKPSKIMKTISLFKSELVYPQYLIDGELLKELVDREQIKTITKEHIETKENFDLFKVIYSRYQKKLSQNKLIDVDDILMHAVRLVYGKPSVLEELQERFRYLMVDEYQDTNHAQYVLTNLLAAKDKNLGVVGDDSQSIYGFRGSDMRNILNFMDDYPDALQIKLEENYRSTQTILKAANELISNNAEQKEKALFTAKEIGSTIKLHKASFNVDEADFIAREIKRLVEDENYDYRDISIFYRNNADSSILETVFPEHDIPFILSKDASFFDRKEVKDILAYLSFLNNPSDVYSFSQIINYPKRGIGKTTVSKIIKEANGGDLIAVCKRPETLNRINDKTKKGLSDFVSLFETFQNTNRNHSISSLIQTIISDINYKETYRHLETYLKKEKDDYLEKLISITQELENKNDQLSLEEFGRLLSKTDVDANMTEESFNKVNLLTVHSAKGLEFPVVFIIGMKEQGFPSKFAMTDKAIEEERRICYVAFTRAKEKLYLSYPKKYIEKIDKETKEERENKPSRFLSEFSSDLLEEI